MAKRANINEKIDKEKRAIINSGDTFSDIIPDYFPETKKDIGNIWKDSENKLFPALYIYITWQNDHIWVPI